MAISPLDPHFTELMYHQTIQECEAWGINVPDWLIEKREYWHGKYYAKIAKQMARQERRLSPEEFERGFAEILDRTREMRK